MNYKEFCAWMNRRASDGNWKKMECLLCLLIKDEVEKKPFWKRNKEFARVSKKYALKFDVMLERDQNAEY